MHTNTLHGVRAREGTDPAVLALGFYNSLTMLSAELLARSYGGGVLKLEPTEAEALLIPPLDGFAGSRELLTQVDGAIRRGQLDTALEIVDEIALRDGLGMNEEEVLLLRQGAERLRARRHARHRRPHATEQPDDSSHSLGRGKLQSLPNTDSFI
jgi:adenine-specific DNA-methyltransferase